MCNPVGRAVSLFRSSISRRRQENSGDGEFERSEDLQVRIFKYFEFVEAIISLYDLLAVLVGVFAKNTTVLQSTSNRANLQPVLVGGRLFKSICMACRIIYLIYCRQLF